MAFTRSTTGCFGCKSRRKKCDETKPQCLRCQNSRIQCPGYTYIQDPSGKLRTLPGPRAVDRSRATTLQTSPLMNVDESFLQLRGQSTLEEDLINFRASYSTTCTPVETNGGEISESIGRSNRLVSSSSIIRSLQHSIDLNTSRGVVVDHSIPEPNQVLQNTAGAASMTSGQASLLAALFSLGSATNPGPPPRRIQLTTNPNVLYNLNWPLPNTQRQDDGNTHGNEYLDGTANPIGHEPALDRTVESNALSFVLQGYATWISGMALDPQKLMGIARDFVFGHFEDGEQSRWIISLLANIGSRMGSMELVEQKRNPLVSALHSVVRRRLRAIKSRPKSTRSELSRALDSTLETILVHSHVCSVGEAATLRQDAGSIFRQLCPGPANAPIDLLSLLHHRMDTPWRFAQMDIIFSVATDIPTLFRYEVSIPGIQQLYARESVMTSDGIVQWLHGIPNQLILLFAKMTSMRAEELSPSEETIALVVQEIIKIPSFNGSSSDRFLGIMRFVVQECWRQVSLVYLYMAVCGDASNTPRVKQAFTCFIKLLGGTKPGHLPDEFLTPPLIIISPAAQRKRDRETIRQRILGLKTCQPNDTVTSIIEHYWARADAEGRPIIWSDVAMSRRQVLGA